jgi:hypothetical protein
MSTNFYHSAEIRWFWPGADGFVELLTWFSQPSQSGQHMPGDQSLPQPDAAQLVAPERPRTDEYLLLPAGTSVGIKQRQGRLEVKALVAGPRPFTRGPVSGQLDEWVKWSWQPATAVARPVAADLAQSGPWRPVTKRRYTQRYALRDDKLVSVSPTTLPSAGCSLELTWLQLPAAEEIWLTLGFEAFGPPGRRLPALLAAAVDQFLTSHGRPPRPLVAADSKSYPAWLATLPL